MDNKKIKLYNEDCLERLRLIEDKSISLAIYDPPYFSTGIESVGDKQWKNEEEYINWCIEVIKETQRVLRDNGSFYWFHNDPDLMTDILYRIKYETDFNLKNQITWNKLNNWKSANIKEGAGMYRSVLQCYGSQKSYNGSTTEYIYYFTLQDETGLKKVKTDLSNFQSLREYSKNIQDYIGLKIGVINKTLGHRRAEHFFYHSSTQWDLCTQEIYVELIEVFNINKWSGFKEYEDLRKEYEYLRREYEYLRFPFNTENKNFKGIGIDKTKESLRPYTTVWEYDRDEEYYKYNHMTPKPLEMIKHIIRVSSRPGDTILDCVMGSGTTGVATIEVGEGRKFIGVESSETHFNNARERIENTYNKLKINYKGRDWDGK